MSVSARQVDVVSSGLRRRLHDLGVLQCHLLHLTAHRYAHCNLISCRDITIRRNVTLYEKVSFVLANSAEVFEIDTLAVDTAQRVTWLNKNNWISSCGLLGDTLFQ